MFTRSWGQTRDRGIDVVPDHAWLELSDGIRAGVLHGYLRCHGKFPSSERQIRGEFIFPHGALKQKMTSSEEGLWICHFWFYRTNKNMWELEHQDKEIRPVSDGFGHEVILGDVLSERDETSGLVQDVLPHQTRHSCHALNPCHVSRDVGARVWRSEIHL